MQPVVAAVDLNLRPSPSLSPFQTLQGCTPLQRPEMESRTSRQGSFQTDTINEQTHSGEKCYVIIKVLHKHAFSLLLNTKTASFTLLYKSI